MTRKNVLHRVVRDLRSLVDDGGVERFALCGGLALAVWGTPRATRDIDFMVSLPAGRTGSGLVRDLERLSWVIASHERHDDDPVPELIRAEVAGVTIDLLIATRTWEDAVLEDAETLGWQGVDLPSVRAEALAAMKLRAGGPQDLVDAEKLQALPTFDAAAFQAWKKRLRIRA